MAKRTMVEINYTCTTRGQLRDETVSRTERYAGGGNLSAWARALGRAAHLASIGGEFTVQEVTV